MFGKQYTFVIVSEEERSKIKAQDGIVYVCNDLFRIDFLCPCGCKDWITLNTLPDTKPRWTFVAMNSISPSIQRTVGCKSHFFITKGIVSKTQVNNKIKGK